MAMNVSEIFGIIVYVWRVLPVVTFLGCRCTTSRLVHWWFLFFFCWFSEVNQDSLDGAQPTVSDVGSAEEFEKEREEDTPSASNGDAEGNTVISSRTGLVPVDLHWLWFILFHLTRYQRRRKHWRCSRRSSRRRESRSWRSRRWSGCFACGRRRSFQSGDGKRTPKWSQRRKWRQWRQTWSRL